MASGSQTSLPAEWVRLNVGGKLFMTTRTTLCRYELSFLHRLCLDDPGLPTYKDESGAYLIDRDPEYFSPILNYLRHGKLCFSEGTSLEAILEEAEFYNLASLVKLVKERMKDSNSPTGSESETVYRVLSCRETEVSQMLSTMSRGWKCEQVVSASSDRSEFLIIVSQEVMTKPQSPFANQSDKLNKTT